PSGPPRGMRGLGRFQTAQPRLHSRKPSACMTTEKENCVPPFPEDVFTEPEPDPHTLRNLGPLTPLAGIWEGRRGLDVHPAEQGTEKNEFIERIELQPIDGQTNRPQLYYGLRYHTPIGNPDAAQ